MTKRFLMISNTEDGFLRTTEFSTGWMVDVQAKLFPEHTERFLDFVEEAKAGHNWSPQHMPFVLVCLNAEDDTQAKASVLDHTSTVADDLLKLGTKGNK